MEPKVDEYALYISFDTNKPEQEARIRSKLTGREKELFTKFLQANKDVFTWFAKDMPCHRLYLDPTARPIIERKRNHGMEWSRIIEVKIDKLKDANFIIEVHHQDWLVNIVVMQK